MSLKTEIFNSIPKIPQSYWDDLKCTSNVYYSPEFLKAFEAANTNIEFYYIFIIQDEKAIAFANAQLVTISVKTITQNIKMNTWLKRNINRSFCDNAIRILFCGNIFLSGEYGTFLREDKNKVEAFQNLAKGIRKLYKQLKRLTGIFIKDFKNESLYITHHLETFGYATMQVEPNMIIHLKSEWQSFNDYKNALKSKYRIKANKADSMSEVLVAKRMSSKDIESYKAELQELYQNTIDNADFNAQVLDLNTYSYLKDTYKNLFTVIGYFLDEKLVGFLSAMKNGDNLDAHFIGIDYSLNKTYAIYPRILNDYVRLGIETSSEQINLGRTASEIKSTLGAKPQTLTCYFKHKNPFLNLLLKPIVRRASIKTYKQHQPFK